MAAPDLPWAHGRGPTRPHHTIIFDDPFQGATTLFCHIPQRCLLGRVARPTPHQRHHTSNLALFGMPTEAPPSITCKTSSHNTVRPRNITKWLIFAQRPLNSLMFLTPPRKRSCVALGAKLFVSHALLSNGSLLIRLKNATTTSNLFDAKCFLGKLFAMFLGGASGMWLFNRPTA